jgi:hypothetical protein
VNGTAQKIKLAVPIAPQPLEMTRASGGKAAAREKVLAIGNRE